MAITYVIMITQNKRVALMRKALMSVLAQSVHSWHVLVVETSSSPIEDSQLLDLLADPHVTRLSAVGMNVADARNLAADHVPDNATLLTLDDDDYLARTCIERLQAKMADGYDVVYGDCWNVCDGMLELRATSGVPYSKEAMLLACCIFHPALHTKAIHLVVGGRKADYVRAEDYDFFLRVSEVPSVRIGRVCEPLYFYRCDAGHVSMYDVAEACSDHVQAARAAAITRRL